MRLVDRFFWRPMASALMKANSGAPRRPRRGFRWPHRRGYKAAKSSRLLEGRPTTPQSSDFVLRSELRMLRAGSRHAAENSPHARKFLTMVRSNVIGPQGIGLQSRAEDQDGKPDTLLIGAIERAWADWSRAGVCDVTGRLSWKAAQGLAATNLAMDGEVLIRLYRGRSAGPHGFALQFLDPELLPVNLEKALPNGNFIKMGIEYDKFERAVAYHLSKVDPARDAIYGGYTARGTVRVPASEMIHLFVVERVGQKRGVPWMAAVLDDLQALDSYDEFAMTAARLGAAKIGFYYNESGEPYAGTGVETPGSESDGLEPDGAAVTDIEGGTIEELLNGKRFEGWDPTYPHAMYAEFTRARLRRLSAGMAVSYQGLSNDLSDVNFSSIRSGVLEERGIWMAAQEFIVEHLCQPLFDQWLPMALISGRIRYPDGAQVIPEGLDSMRRTTWQPRRWEWVDPLKDAKAITEAVGLPMKSISESIRDRGRDPQEVFDEIKREREELRKLGIVVSGPASDALANALLGEKEDGASG